VELLFFRQQPGGKDRVLLVTTDSPIRKRRKLTGEKKYEVLEEIKSHPERKAEILRREGLYTGDIMRFERVVRAAAIAALHNNRPGKRAPTVIPFEQFEQLREELGQKEKALAEMSVEYFALKKKVNGR
jgi:hypothetical protein